MAIVCGSLQAKWAVCLIWNKSFIWVIGDGYRLCNAEFEYKVEYKVEYKLQTMTIAFIERVHMKSFEVELCLRTDNGDKFLRCSARTKAALLGNREKQKISQSSIFSVC